MAPLAVVAFSYSPDSNDTYVTLSNVSNVNTSGENKSCLKSNASQGNTTSLLLWALWRDNSLNKPFQKVSTRKNIVKTDLVPSMVLSKVLYMYSTQFPPPFALQISSEMDAVLQEAIVSEHVCSSPT